MRGGRGVAAGDRAGRLGPEAAPLGGSKVCLRLHHKHTACFSPRSQPVEGRLDIAGQLFISLARFPKRRREPQRAHSPRGSRRMYVYPIPCDWILRSQPLKRPARMMSPNTFLVLLQWRRRAKARQRSLKQESMRCVLARTCRPRTCHFSPISTKTPTACHYASMW